MGVPASVFFCSLYSSFSWPSVWQELGRRSSCFLRWRPGGRTCIQVRVWPSTHRSWIHDKVLLIFKVKGEMRFMPFTTCDLRILVFYITDRGMEEFWGVFQIHFYKMNILVSCTTGFGRALSAHLLFLFWDVLVCCAKFTVHCFFSLDFFQLWLWYFPINSQQLVADNVRFSFQQKSLDICFFALYVGPEAGEERRLCWLVVIHQHRSVIHLKE